MDLLKAVMGLGEGIKNIFSRKKKREEDMPIYTPKPQKAPTLASLNLTPTPRPSSATLKTAQKPAQQPLSMPNLSFNQPKKQPVKIPTVQELFNKTTTNIVTKTAPAAAKSIAKNIVDAGGRMGKGIGGAVQAQPITIAGVPMTNAAQKESMDRVNADIASKNLATAIKLVRAGKKEDAQRLFDANKKLFADTAARDEVFRKQLDAGKKDVIVGGIKTGLYALGANALTNPAAVAAAGAIGGGLHKVFGGDKPFEAAGEAIGELPKYETVGKAVGVALGPVFKHVNKLNNPVTRQFVARTLSGLGSVAENEILAKLDEKDTTSQEKLLAFALGSMTSNGGKNSIEGWENMKQDTKDLIIAGGKKLKLDVRPAGDVWQIRNDPVLKKYANWPNFVYEGYDKLRSGDYPAGLSVKAKGSVTAAADMPQSAIRYSQSHREGLLDAMGNSETQEQAVSNIKKYLDDNIARLNKTPNANEAKGLRAAINRAMYTLADVDPKRGKGELKVFNEAFKNPDVAQALETLDGYKGQVDNIIAGKIKVPEQYGYHGTPSENLQSIQKGGLKVGKSGAVAFTIKGEDAAANWNKELNAGAEGAVLRVNKTKIKTFLEDGGEIFSKEDIPPEMIEVKQGKNWIPLSEYKPEGNKTIRLMDTPSNELPLEDKLKKFEIDKAIERGNKEISAEQGGAPKTGARTAEQIIAEQQSGTYRPRTKGAPGGKNNVPPSGGAPEQPKIKERGFVTSVKESENVTGAAKQKTTGSYETKTNDALMGEAKALMTDGATIDFRNTKDLDKKVAVTIQEAINLDKAGQHDAAANLYNNLSEHGTELGRGVQAFSLLDKMSPQAIALSAAGKIKKYNATHQAKIPELTGDQVKEISAIVERIDSMTGREKNIAINELGQKLNSYIPSTLVDKAITVWKAGLLTSFRTHERNLIGNAIMSVSELAKDAPATLADKLMAMKTGKRSVTLTTQGTGAGAKKGYQAMKDVMRYGFDPEETINKFDVKQVNWGNNPVEQALKKYTDAVFRTLGGEDKVFWNSSFARSLYDQAGAEAINAGKQGDQAFIKGLVDKPSEQMLKTAAQDANYATFHDKNIMNRVASMFKGAIKSGKEEWQRELGKLVAEGFMPFTGVPSSIVEKTVAYSPVGLVKGIAKAGKVVTQNVPELQRQAAQEIGRGTMGTALFSLGAYLASKGLMTGQPKDKDEAELWRMQNKQANSILIGGKWRSINSVGPQTLILLAGAKYNEDMQSEEGGLGKFAFDLGKDQLSQTFLAGVQQPLNAITDPARYGQSYVGNQVSTLMPNIGKDLSRALDDTQRETNTLSDYLQNTIPLARNYLLPKRDVMGNELPQEPTGIGAFFDLFNSKTPKDDATVNELYRLYSTGNDATPSKLQPKQTIQKEAVKLTFEQLNSLEKGVGEALKPQLEALIGSDTYQQMTDDGKAKAINNLVKDVRTKYKNLNAQELLSGQPAETDPLAPASANATEKKSGLKAYSYVDPQGNYREIDIDKVASMPEDSRYEKTLKQKAAFKIVDDILDNLPEDQQAGALKAIGMDENSATYYNIARQTDDAKTAYLLDRIEYMDDRNAMLDMLVQGRADINGKMITSNSVIDDLYDQGIITKAEATALKKVKLNEKGEPTRKTTSGTGAGLTNKKIETMLNKAKAFGKQFAIGEAPEIDTTIPRTTKQSAKAATAPKTEFPAEFFTSNVPIPKVEVPSIEELIKNTQGKLRQNNIEKAKEIVARSRGAGGSKSAKLSSSFFRGSS